MVLREYLIIFRTYDRKTKVQCGNGFDQIALQNAVLK